MRPESSGDHPLATIGVASSRQRRIARRAALNALATSSERRSRRSTRFGGRAADPLLAVQTAPPRQTRSGRSPRFVSRRRAP
jgi:hypothetical protein